MSNPTEDFIRRMNSNWRDRSWEALATAYDLNAVLLPPDAGAPIVGREAILATYSEFDSAATLDDFEINELDVYHFEAVDMVHMRFELAYELDGEKYRESGLEIYAVTHTPTSRILWRHQSLLDQQTLES